MDFFISYRHEDKLLAGRIAHLLKASGHTAFLAHETMMPSLDFEDEIRIQLENCTALVAVITPNFSGSAYSNQEVGIAMGKGKPVIPLWFPAVEKSELGFLHSLQAIQTSEERLGETVSKIVDTTEEAIKANFVRPSGFTEAGSLIDTLLESRKEPYYRVLVRPQSLYQMFLSSKGNDEWLFSNRPSLLRDMDWRPNRSGITFYHPGPYHAEVNNSGEISYGEAVAKIDGVTIGRPIVILSELSQFARKVYEKFGWNEQNQGSVVIEIKLGNVHKQELRLGHPSVWKGRSEQKEIQAYKTLPLTKLAEPRPIIQSIVIDICRDFGMSIDENEARGYMDSVLGRPTIETISQ